MLRLPHIVVFALALGLVSAPAVFAAKTPTKATKAKVATSTTFQAQQTLAILDAQVDALLQAPVAPNKVAASHLRKSLGYLQTAVAKATPAKVMRAKFVTPPQVKGVPTYGTIWNTFKAFGSQTAGIKMTRTQATHLARATKYFKAAFNTAKLQYRTAQLRKGLNKTSFNSKLESIRTQSRKYGIKFQTAGISAPQVKSLLAKNIATLAIKAKATKPTQTAKVKSQTATTSKMD
ncbi:MAG: hypothetical protein COV10_02670 [Candidatus Vogelbacteria bacterium CG10_big_fil_rev_8_21_14_0_10_51_16]|uniref:DUF5667 domain-containing protein n=1 Tax=Candidatus Vogelbacteria bacterium CG10_big_fil_rev_8_21_14_0_10_51_16 TaxID=1975045 RepID=A0A2H0RE48_9BACT|nr:MAG: hypothetical protein COV10_02670 [Candidatus Vogelbacteria bacterium CG10_big_fil_rev_8_21_14_0_10_51_16]